LVQSRARLVFSCVLGVNWAQHPSDWVHNWRITLP
jgi:hypothetical protein